MGASNQKAAQKQSNQNVKNKNPQQIKTTTSLQTNQQPTIPPKPIEQIQSLFSLPSQIQNRPKVRQVISKYNDRIQIQMKKPYVQQFFKMRQKLLKNMQFTCRDEYLLDKKQKTNKQFKQCMAAVQSLITDEDQRMQSQFGVKLFLLADKCLLKEERRKYKKKQDKGDQIEYCLQKLLKYRGLNMQMHVLKLQLAKQML